MKTFKYVVSVIFLLIGIGFVVRGPVLPEDFVNPLKPIALGIAFFMWGVSLNLYTKSNYRGGAASIIGAFLVGFGLYTSADVLHMDKSLADPQKLAIYVAVALLYVAGAALLRQGHRIHKEIAEREKK